VPGIDERDLHRRGADRSRNANRPACESSTASRAFVNRLMNTCSSWMGLPTTTGLFRAQVERDFDLVQSELLLHEGQRTLDHRPQGDRLTADGAALPNVRRCEMICVAFDTCCMAWRSSRTICPLSATPSSMRSTALPTTSRCC